MNKILHGVEPTAIFHIDDVAYLEKFISDSLF